MATKSGILTTINGFLTAIITQTKVRSASETIVDEIYPSVVNDSVDDETYTTKGVSGDLDYSITIHKSGNQCFIKGSVINNRTYSVDAQSIFTWKDSEYQPKATINNVTFRAIFGTGSNINLQLTDTGLNLTSSINALGSYTFDYKFYIAKD